jgi:hypothetical protein
MDETGRSGAPFKPGVPSARGVRALGWKPGFGLSGGFPVFGLIYDFVSRESQTRTGKAAVRDFPDSRPFVPNNFSFDALRYCREYEQLEKL